MRAAHTSGHFNRGGKHSCASLVVLGRNRRRGLSRRRSRVRVPSLPPLPDKVAAPRLNFVRRLSFAVGGDAPGGRSPPPLPPPAASQATIRPPRGELTQTCHTVDLTTATALPRSRTPSFDT